MRKLTALDPSMMGPEPTWTDPNKQPTLSNALNWYSYSFNNKDAKEFVLDYIKLAKRPKEEIELVKSVPENKIVRQLGWIARMISACGYKPDESSKNFFMREYKKIIDFAKQIKQPEQVEDVVAQPIQKKVSIQDRILDKAREEVGDIEGLIDDFVASRCKSNIDLQNYFNAKKLSSVVLNKICDIMIKRSAHLADVLTSADPQYKEAYSNFTKPELRRLKEFVDGIISFANKGAIANKPVRKARKKKEKPASVLVAKVSYLEEDPETKLKSLRPERLIGATQAWVYNAKTRMLGVYFSSDGRGFSVKGMTLTNFDKEKSVAKKLRKPQETIDALMKAGKIKLRQLMNTLTTKESQLTGRLNSDTLIARVEA